MSISQESGEVKNYQPDLTLEDRIKEWNREAPHWMCGRHFLKTERTEQREAVECALLDFRLHMVDSGEKILDLGAAGTTAEYLGKALMPRVVSVDFASTALNANPGKFRVIADVQRILPFKDSSFGWVTMFFLSRYLDDQEATMQEIYRLLKPGGRFIAMDFQRNGIELERAEFKPKQLIPSLEKIGFQTRENRELFPELDFREEFSFYRGPLHLLVGQKLKE